MTFPENLRYTKDHEWVNIQGQEATVGITDFAQSELGDIVFVEIESVGKTLQQHEVFGTVEAVKTVSDLFLPLDGEVIALNSELADSPEAVNSDPYGKGWMIKLKLTNPSQVDGLMSSEEYKSLVGA